MGLPQFKITLPCKPYIKAHLQNRYGTPIDFPDESAEKKLLNQLLARASHERDSRPINYTDTAVILIEPRIFYRYGHSLTRTAITSYNTYLEDLFKREMRLYILLNVRFKKNITVVIHDFLEEYNLENKGLAEDAIQKDFFRHRKKNQISLEGQRWVKKYAPSVLLQSTRKKSGLTGSDYGIFHKPGELI